MGVNQNKTVLHPNTKNMNWKMLKCSIEFRESAMLGHSALSSPVRLMPFELYIVFSADVYIKILINAAFIHSK